MVKKEVISQYKRPIVFRNWDQVKAELKEQGYTTGQLSKLLSTPYRTVQRWLNSKKKNVPPGNRMYPKLLQFYAYSQYLSLLEQTPSSQKSCKNLKLISEKIKTIKRKQKSKKKKKNL